MKNIVDLFGEIEAQLEKNKAIEEIKKNEIE